MTCRECNDTGLVQDFRQMLYERPVLVTSYCACSAGRARRAAEAADARGGAT